MSKATRNTIIILTAGFVLLTLKECFEYSFRAGGTDLRCRTVGTRLLLTDHSPYFYKWNPADGERLLDPNDRPNRYVNGNVVSPAWLVVLSPLSQLSYPNVRLLWTILQLAAAFLTIFLVVRKTPGPKIMTCLMAVLGMFCSEIWLYHVERGQLYIFFALLFALGYHLYNSTFRYHEFLSGVVGGLFIFFRPFAALPAIGFLLYGRKRWILGCATGVLIGLALFVMAQMDIWNDYRQAMVEYNNEALGKARVTDGSSFEIPTVIEGSVNLKKATHFNVNGLASIQSYLKRFHIVFTNTHAMVLYGLLVAVLSFLFYRQRRIDPSPQRLYLFGFLLYILAEVCMIVPRGDYNAVQWMFALPLLYALLSRSPVMVCILIAILLFLHNFPVSISFQAALSEVALIGLTAYSIFNSKLTTKASPSTLQVSS